MKIDPETLKKLLQAGAYATDAMSKGSAGGLGKAIVDSKIDLSGKNNPFNEQNTEDAAGHKAKRTGKYSTDHPDIYKGRDYDDPEYGT